MSWISVDTIASSTSANRKIPCSQTIVILRRAIDMVFFKDDTAAWYIGVEMVTQAKACSA
jgi:hypothetical protein